PRHIMAEWPGPVYKPGTRIALAVFVVNDLKDACRGRWRWAAQKRGETLAEGGAPVELQADGLVAVPSGVDWTVPAGQQPGAVDLVLTLDLDDGTQVSNRYRFDILPEI
ncbi:MAG TPA: hypothetical protein VK464_23115, partial [Symbiobacteriaceae bacterium]|nr:hypothetical protein [Symbiobacteriaceae bacterium]